VIGDPRILAEACGTWEWQCRRRGRARWAPQRSAEACDEDEW